MLVKNTYIGISPINGLGLYAAEFIKQGETVWVPGFENIYTIEEAKEFDVLVQNFLKHYGYIDIEDGKWHLSLDNDRFINHSTNPNIEALKGVGMSIAVRNIITGEEITENYYTFEMNFYARDRFF